VTEESNVSSVGIGRQRFSMGVITVLDNDDEA
jgi:hypothetical protein